MIDWNSLRDEPAAATAGPKERLRWVGLGFALLSLLILARAWQLELRDGEGFRTLAAQPRWRTRELPAERGQIVDRRGTVLAEDETTNALCVRYRWLQDPPDERWLRQVARSRLSKAERKDSFSVKIMQEFVRAEHHELPRLLAEICEIDEAVLRGRIVAIQQRVTALTASVQRRRQAVRQKTLDDEMDETAAGQFWQWGSLLFDDTADDFAVTPLAEEVGLHVLLEALTPDQFSRLRVQAKSLPAIEIVDFKRRSYPQSSLAAHVVGFVGSDEHSAIPTFLATSGDAVREATGKQGIEQLCESRLCGTPGKLSERLGERGKIVESGETQPAVPGERIQLTLDAQLQLVAEKLLDESYTASDSRQPKAEPLSHCGAILVLDVQTGEILTAASAPRFDPNEFAARSSGYPAQALTDPRKPLFDRALKMAIPPGSVFKLATAVALLETGVIDAETSFACRGYLEVPDRQRCQIFRQHGVGHGEVTLKDALAQSCNVFFYHHASQAGAAPLIHWATRLGCATPTGIELPESIGTLSSPESLRSHGRAWRPTDTQALSIGQGELTMTPLQVARLVTAVASGRLVSPRIIASGEPASTGETGQPLSRATIAAVQAGMLDAIRGSNGTAYQAFQGCRIPVAGKTGTAETGGDQPDHAWFAGFAPVNQPRYAVVVALEHGGSGGSAAAPIARAVFERLSELGYLKPEPILGGSFPPGRG